MSSSSELVKRKKDFDNNNSNLPPVKKQKISSSSINNRKYSFPSIICADYKLDSVHFNLTLCISNEKNIFSVGYSGKLSHGHENKRIFPIKQIKGITNIKMVDCGDNYSICLNYTGDVFSFGSNSYGQLGIGNNELKETHIPQKINLPPCKQVSCGSFFNICLTDDNTLYSFGHNFYGQLGLGNYNKYYSSPQLIPGFNNIEYITCSGRHSICKTYNNEFYSWGSNNYDQLGQGNNDDKCNKPIQCLNWPDNIISMKCGYYHSLLLTLDGQIYSFGDNRFAQLGLNDKNMKSINKPTLIQDIPEIQRIECGSWHSICIDINNNLWLFGNNNFTQLGLGDKEQRYKPILHPTLSNIIDISSRGNHTFVKTIDNKIYAFGFNNYSQLGKKTGNITEEQPIQVFEGNEDIWCSTIGKSKQKSARK